MLSLLVPSLASRAAGDPPHGPGPGSVLAPLVGIAIAAAPEELDDGPPASETELAVVVDLATRLPERWTNGLDDAYPLTPERWRRRMPRECRTRGGYRAHCQGPRLVPTPRGPAGRLGTSLGLGQRATALSLMNQAPLPEWLDAAQATDAETRLTFPVVEGHLGRGFGRTREGSLRHRRHYGVDIGAPEGTPVLAARGGLVAYSDNGITGYGNVVILLHEDGFSTLYGHCRETLVFAGQRVERGEVIARVGQTGFAPAPHLHFEWRQRGWARDPVRQFLDPRDEPDQSIESPSADRR